MRIRSSVLTSVGGEKAPVSLAFSLCFHLDVEEREKGGDLDFFRPSAPLARLHFDFDPLKNRNGEKGRNQSLQTRAHRETKT